jgi:hypothetical protein
MTEWIVSKNGLRVPKVNGICLCSMIDPVREAKKWFDSYRDIVQDFDHIFVMGIGGGFHIDLLIDEVPNALITVIEKESDTILGLREKISSWGDRVAIVSNPTEETIKNYESFHGVFEQASYCVLVHPMSYNANSCYYKELEDFILGRSSAGLNYINSVKAQKNEYFDKLQSRLNLNGTESIKEIVGKIEKSNLNLSEEDLIWLSLGEIIH